MCSLSPTRAAPPATTTNNNNTNPADMHKVSAWMSDDNERQPLLVGSTSAVVNEVVDDSGATGKEPVVLESMAGVDQSYPEDLLDEPDAVVDKRNMLWLRMRYYLPVLGWLPKYKLSYLLPDFVAGSSVAFLLIPQGLSYATLVTLSTKSSVYGLYGAFFPLLIYAILAVVALITGQAVLSAIPKDPEATPEELDAMKIEYIGVLNFLVGTITLVMGLLRLGFLDAIFSRATNRGFITGVGFVVMTEQLVYCLGLSTGFPEDSSPLEKLIHVFAHLNETQWLPLVFSVLAFGYLLAMDTLKHRFPNALFLKFIPNILLVVLVSIFFTWLLDLESAGLKVFGEVTPGFQAPRFPAFSPTSLSLMVPNAVVIVIVGFVESIIVGKTMAAAHNYALSDNRELVAFGAANMFSSLFGAYSSFGSMPRTRMNDTAGAKTQLAGLISSMYVLVAIMVMLPMFEYLPRATAGAIVMFAAYSLIEAHDFVYFYKMHAWFDMTIAVTCFLATYILGVEVGVYLTLAICIGLLVKTVTRDAFMPMGYVAQTNTFKPLGPKDPTVKWVDGILIIRFLDSMFYANSGLLKERLRRLELFGTLGMHPGSEVREDKLEAVIFDFERMATIDISALALMEEVFNDYNTRNIAVFAVQLNESVRKLMDRAHMMRMFKNETIYASIEEAVGIYKQSKGTAHVL